MKKLIYIIAAAAVLASCGRYDERFEDLHNQLDSLMDVRIKPLAEQVNAIDVTVENAEETQAALKDYIDELDASLDGMNSQLDSLDSEIAKLDSDIHGDISSMETDVRAQLAEQRSYMQGLIDVVTETLARLKQSDENLSKRIEELKASADSRIADAKDWTTGTYATLEEYNETCDVIAAIQATIAEMNSMLVDEEETFAKAVEDINAAMSSLDTTLKGEISTLSANIASEVSNFRSRVEAAYNEALEKSLADTEKSMKEWVNVQLSSYYDIAATDALIASYKTRIEGKINAQAEYLESVLDSLSSALNAKISANSELIDKLQSDIEASASRENSYTTRIANLSTDITTNATNIGKNALAILKNESEIRTLNPLVSANKELITATQEKIAELKKAVSDLDASLDEEDALIQQDAQDILKNSTDIANVSELISKNAAAISSNTTAASQNAGDIAALLPYVDVIKNQLEEAYKSAISEAIETSEGKLTAALVERVSTVNAQIDSFEVDTNNRIDKIKARLDNVDSEISEIKSDFADIQVAIKLANDNIALLFSRIQSVTWLPESADGTATAHYYSGVSADATLRYKVLPSGTAEQLADHPEYFSAVYVETITKAPTEVALPVSIVGATGDILTVVFDCSSIPDSFFDGTTGASVSMIISHGSNCFQTAYVPLKAVAE